jgi:hypothetical protein
MPEHERTDRGRREGGEGIPKIVDPAQRLGADGELCGLLLAVAEVVQVEVATTLGREEQRAVLVRRLALERVEGDRLQRHRPQAGLCPRALQPTFRERATDINDVGFDIDS